jgi:protein-L-isoaspartate O-methyltransferase
VSWRHFEESADEYDRARPAYPHGLVRALADEGVTGPGRDVLEIGAGSGLATGVLVAAGCRAVALEPGERLATILGERFPDVEVVRSRVEDAVLQTASYDAVVAATSMHWVDLPTVLPRLHAALRPSGSLAVFRHLFGDEDVRTPFRDRVDAIVAQRGEEARASRPEARPAPEELTAGGWFRLVRSETWRWSVELTDDEVAALFATFSNWTAGEVEQVRVAAQECGGRVTEHYRTVLHLLRRA